VLFKGERDKTFSEFSAQDLALMYRGNAQHLVPQFGRA
jgi:hypothetical protein